MKKNKIKELALEFLNQSDSDAVGIAIIDFKSKEVESYEYCVDKNEKSIWFDLASLSKPLNNSYSFIARGIEDEKLKLLMNHKASIPSWGLLPRSSWKEQIFSYPIKESAIVYSDFSALRYMLEIEKKLKIGLKEMVSPYWGDEVKFWKDLIGDERVLQNGYIKGLPNFGKVHDPNAYNLNCYVNHAGLFGTIGGLSNSLLNFDKKFDLLNRVKEEIKLATKERFVLGFDRAQGENSLAGPGCSAYTFGHLGFTGTSFWIDPVKRKGFVLLTNSTKKFWYAKAHLNKFRRELGKLVWSME